MTASRSTRHPGRIVTSALVAGACAALALAGCSAGQLSQTAHTVPAVPGANVTVGSIALRDLLIPYTSIGGYPAGASAPMVVRIFNDGTKDVTLTGATADKASAVTLVGGPAPSTTVVSPAATTPAPAGSIIASASPGGSVTPSGSTSPSGPVAGSVSPSVPAATSPSASTSPSAPAAPSKLSIHIAAQSYLLLVPGQGGYLQLTGLTEAIVPGGWVTVTFSFDDGSTAKVQIPLAPPSTNLPRPSPIVPTGESK